MLKLLKIIGRLLKKLFSEFGTVEGKERRDEYDRQQKLKELDDEIRELRIQMDHAVIMGDESEFMRLSRLRDKKVRERSNL